MAAITTLTVYDGAATPVLHNLIPVSVTRENGKVISYWRENLGGLPTVAQVSCTMTLERLKSGVWKCVTRTEMPVMESVSGANAAGYTAAPKVAYVNTMETTSFFHERSDATGRCIVRQLHANILAGEVTSQVVVYAGPAPELINNLVSPT